MEKLYLIRHCKAAGQAAEAELTMEGFAQAQELADFLMDHGIEKIVCSPFLRAIQSIQPLAQRLHVEIEIKNRLAERVLSSRDLPDWLDHLRNSFHDLDKCLPGGESSRAAMQRIRSVVDELRTADHKCIAAVTHGNLMSLLLKHVDNRFGFEQWQSLSNPDIYCLSEFDAEPKLQRIWTSKEI
ncbi:histidine phosphatase family protein [Paenibacillus whitsoniae]|uniref:Histidine phosphatase family protein n=1 Tax=Paenibacillus whitsoniae TaxID=2496558 RepID=A0A430J9M3_9BACL|nr:histidine phosphatase family protein [Paenibacillus whitsoniae]RTE07203.1 histidine phosphatase family protein [Paenibacillus whitsoniae]